MISNCDIIIIIVTSLNQRFMQQLYGWPFEDILALTFDLPMKSFTYKHYFWNSAKIYIKKPYIKVNAYTYIRMCIYVCVFVCALICACVFVCTFVCVCLCVCVFVCVYLCVHLFVCLFYCLNSFCLSKPLKHLNVYNT